MDEKLDQGFQLFEQILDGLFEWLKGQMEENMILRKDGKSKLKEITTRANVINTYKATFNEFREFLFTHLMGLKLLQNLK